MKFVVLLALVGLASCSRNSGGHFGKDVKIQYTFEDHDGDEVKVEEEHDRLQEVRAPDFRAAARAEAKTPKRKVAFVDSIDDEDVRFVPASVPVSRPRSRLVGAAPAPLPKPRVQTQYVEVEAVPALAVGPRVEERLVEVEAAPLRPLRPQAEARFVEVEAVPLPLLRPRAETRFVAVDAVPAPAPRPQVEARLVEVEAPTFRSRKVDLDDDDFGALLIGAAQPVAASGPPPARPQPLAAARYSSPAFDRVSARLAHRVSDSSDEN
ncbi:uncharacterized protein LOC134782124 [Penaeus indicus]|uniref:uncharacterized protein LOC134782124 n=1 Tax=Penaeus indicus TaxID=29960 RepID=UPI00300C396D